MLPNDLIAHRNKGEDQQGRGEGLGGVEKASEDVRNKMEAQTDSTSFQFQTPRTARTKTDAQVAYGARFGRSLYIWKNNFKTLPMELVSGPNSSGVNRNHPRKLMSSFYPGAATPSFGLWALYRVGAH